MKRKLLSLLLMFTLGIGSMWASTDYSVGQYILANVSGSTTYYAFYSATNSTSKYGGTSTIGSAVKFRFEATGVDGEYYWYDVTNSKYVTVGTSGYLAVSDTKDASSDAYKWYMIEGNDGKLTITDKANYNSGNPTKGLVGISGAGGWIATSCTLSSNSNSRYWSLVLQSPTFTAKNANALTTGWYQIKWQNLNSASGDNVVSDVTNKYVMNHDTEVTVDESNYALYLGGTTLSSLSDIVKSFVFFNQKEANSSYGSCGQLRGINGHYVTATGVASSTSSNVYPIWTTYSSPTNITTTSAYTGTRNTLVPMSQTIEEETVNYIGSVSGKFPYSNWSSVTPADLGLKTYTVDILGAGDNDPQLTYSGSATNYGLASVYNGGTFFFSKDASIAANNFSAGTINGYEAVIEISDNVINVTYISTDYSDDINTTNTALVNTEYFTGDATNGYSLGTKAGKIGYLSTSVCNTLLSVMNTANTTANKDNAVALKKAVEVFNNSSDRILPTTGYYRLTNKQRTNMLLYVNPSNTTIQAATGKGSSASSIVRIVDNNDGTFKLQTYNGKYFVNAYQFGEANNAAAFNVTSPEEGLITFTTGGKYMNCSASSLVAWNTYDYCAAWYVNEVENYEYPTFPEAGKFYTIQSTWNINNRGKQFIGGENNSSDAQKAKMIISSEVANGSNIYYYDGQHLMNYSTGKMLEVGTGNALRLADGEATGADIMIVAKTDKTLGLVYKNSSSTYYKANGGSSNAMNYTEGWDTEANGTGWTFTNVTDLPLSKADGMEYATFSAPVNTVVPENAVAYTVESNIADNKVTLTEHAAGSVIPANCGVLMGGEFTAVAVATSGTPFAASNNKLVAAVEAKTVSPATGNNAYVYGAAGDKKGFFQVNTAGTAMTIPGHKCWLEVSTGGSVAQFLAIALGEDATGINEAIATESVDGKFIENGQLVIVKGGVKYNVAGQIVK